ncbi:molybdopterin-dependent oxidoreductase [Spirilliplanes yamanashiensis]|uniref:Oxidoreductase n=1 Tax=Spirilliplanes yamanashiensis TaxID=42233 RepID=A0A8J3Y463_9ACTN|nr:molybdopterin-dependent oxidoreductase [Spirilliplanes yamanashiensis]MDP9820018.1 DMSO/TMAO reductase YedYZ molybdopterin-dependent catalytic subunit [Spirilliplanes yamanashiensis]GIJ01162.1 oxidoreductase [Spirilliplanes yamanashiensis]
MTDSRRPGRLVAAGLGVLGVAAGVAVAELVAASWRPAAGPVVAVGATVIDATPTPLKEFAVRTVGSADKPLLLTGIAVLLTVLAAAAGILARRHRRYALAAGALLGLIGATAAVTRPTAGWTDAVPSLAGGVVAAGALLLLLNSRPVAEAEAAPAGFDRRAFLAAAVVVGAGAAGGGALLLRRRSGGAITAARQAIDLPAAADAAPPLPNGVGPGFVTANADFYRVDTALTLPRIDVDSWRLTLGGMVDQPATFSFADLLDRPLIERHITLNCVSNEVGGPYVGTAKWLGVPLAPLLREAGVRPGADQLVARSVEGMSIGTPVAALLDGRDAMLAVGMNGEPLPITNGFPVRMLTPGLYGYAGSCKWLTELELTRFADVDVYWVQRGWAADGPVKTASRIDRPLPFAQLTAGTVQVMGVAWAQTRGIRRVEVQVDGGAWQPAELLPVPSVDTWVQWRFAWQATAGPHSLRVRATDARDDTQTADRATPFPDGATGWHTVTVTVS